jgi:hypothetical protein
MRRRAKRLRLRKTRRIQRRRIQRRRIQRTASTYDVSHAEQADGHAGEGDVTPPEGVVLAQDVTEDEGQQGE